jgi:hypothetical protein
MQGLRTAISRQSDAFVFVEDNKNAHFVSEIGFFIKVLKGPAWGSGGRAPMDVHRWM